jgi:hypothetical protein
MQERAMKKTYRGSCHCGAVQFEADFDLADGTTRCNCSLCSKSRFWKALVPREDFRLVSGKDDAAEYRFASGTVHHRFCKQCGVKTFGFAELDVEFKGKLLKGGFYAINVGALDGLTPEQFAAIPVTYEDGRHDQWDQAPRVTEYL